MQEKLRTLIAKAFLNQGDLNLKLRPDWIEQGWKYYRAVWTEAAEAIGHTNWYWWKEGTFNKPLNDAQRVELHIEMCDILHFGLSLDIVSSSKGGRDIQARVQDYFDAFQDAIGTSETIDDCLEGVVVDAILLKEFNIKKFARACRASGLTLTGLLTFYFAKSVLNQFRWDHGYNEKTYVKMWKLPQDAKATEDNTHLGAIVTRLLRTNTQEDLVGGLISGELHKSLYDRLSDIYAEVEKPKPAKTAAKATT